MREGIHKIAIYFLLGKKFWRKISGLTLFTLCVFFSPWPAFSGEHTVSLQLKWFHQFQFAGYYAAIEKGFYKEVGLNVIIRQSTPNSEPIRDVIERHSDFGVGTTDLLQYRSQGKPVVLLASIFQHSPLAFMVLKKSGIHNLPDLINHSVMIESHAAELYGYLKLEGIDLSKLELLNHTNNIMDLIEGRVMAMSIYKTDEPYLLKIKGIDYRIFEPVPSGIDFYGDNLFTTEELIEDHPNRVKDFVSASLKGWDYAMSHTEEIADLILRKYSQRKSREHLLFEAEQMKELIMPDTIPLGYTNPSRWEKIVKTYRQLDMLPNGYQLKGFFYSEYEVPAYYFFYKLSLFFLAITIILLCLGIPFYKYYRRLQESEKRYRLLADNLYNVVWTMDLQGRFRYISPSVLRQRGYTPEEAIQQSVEEMLSPDSHQLIKQAFERYINTGEIDHTKWLLRQRCKDGALIITEVTLSPMLDAKGKKIGIIGVSRDVTAQQKAENILKLRLIAIEAASDAIVITDSFGQVEYINPAFTAITGYFIHEIVGKTMDILHSGEHPQSFYDDILNTISQGQTWRGEIINRRKDGSTYTEEQTISPVCDINGNISHYVAIKRDITQKKLFEHQLKHKAQHDHLTQLPNRAHFLDCMHQAVMNDNMNFVVFYLDLDGFKAINDLYGHKLGDFVLQEVANRLRTLLRKCDTVARFGGDEFLILLMGVDNLQDIRQLAEKVISTISKPIYHGANEYKVGASVGVSQYPQDGNTVDSLLHKADARMYSAKKMGKNQACYSDEPAAS